MGYLNDHILGTIVIRGYIIISCGEIYALHDVESVCDPTLETTEASYPLVAIIIIIKKCLQTWLNVYSRMLQQNLGRFK